MACYKKLIGIKYRTKLTSGRKKFMELSKNFIQITKQGNFNVSV